jgi:hypothetical protein
VDRAGLGNWLSAAEATTTSSSVLMSRCRGDRSEHDGGGWVAGVGSGVEFRAGLVEMAAASVKW